MDPPRGVGRGRREPAGGVRGDERMQNQICAYGKNSVRWCVAY